MATSFTDSPTYRRCQARFERAYPQFTDAGSRYAELVQELTRQGARVLDVGAGRMSLASGALGQAGWTAGIDVALDDLQANGSLQAKALADATALPFADGSFDVVISQWVVEHFDDPERAFAEMARVLAADGHMVHFSTSRRHPVAVAGLILPARLRSWLIGRFLRRPAHESHPLRYRANTPDRLRALAAASGLRCRSLEYIGNPFYGAFNYGVFLAALAYERLTDWPPLRPFKLYWVAVLTKRA